VFYYSEKDRRKRRTHAQLQFSYQKKYCPTSRSRNVYNYYQRIREKEKEEKEKFGIDGKTAIIFLLI